MKMAVGRGRRKAIQRPRWSHVGGRIRWYRKPSYTLTKGCERIRAVNRYRLRRLASRLIRRRNWDEASGVMSVLLKSTAKEKCVVNNRNKYHNAMELLKHLDGYTPSSRRVQGLYEIWMKRIGSMKNWPLKDRFVVQLEVILFCLGRGDVEDAHQAAICLMQERQFGSDPVSNMVVGLTFCALWYSVIPQEFLSKVSDKVSDKSHSSEGSERSGTNSDASVQNSKEHETTADIYKHASSFQADSETSVRIDKAIAGDANINENREMPMEVDDDTEKENSYAHSAGTSGEENSSYSNHEENMPYNYIFKSHGFESWLMPVQLSHSVKLENFMSSQRGTLNDYYKNAIKYLRVSLYSSPPVYEALLPLVQMLVLGNYMDEALDELEKFGFSSQTALRAKASILEHIDRGNYVKLSSCYEDILKKNPTCGDSLAKLISLHQRGEYNTQQLLEMIAIHVETSYPGPDIWKEFASCFINLCRCEEDRMSACLDNNEDEIKQGDSIRLNTVPETFTKGKTGKNWKLRGRWWLNRHFSHTILSSEIEAGGLQLLAYKAASAALIYGPDFEYVMKASAYLQEKDRELYLILQMHKQSSLGFYTKRQC